MATAKNNVANVSTVKGVKGGYLFAAPEGTACPTDLDSTLNASFFNLGFVSEDGLSEELDASSENITDMNADTVDTYSDSNTETLKFKLIEQAKDALSFTYGSQNVSLDSNQDIKVEHNWTKADEEYAVVFDGLLKNNRRIRKVIPKCKITERGEVKMSSSEVFGRELTITYFVDDNGVGCYDYIENMDKTSTASTASNKA